MQQDMKAIFAKIQQSGRVVPLGEGAPRATGFEVRFDGGAFTLHLYESRESAEPRSVGALVEAWDNVELARFSLSPLALVRLVNTIAAATRMYETVMGTTLPDEAHVTEATAAFVTEAMKRQATASGSGKRRETPTTTS